MRMCACYFEDSDSLLTETKSFHGIQIKQENGIPFSSTKRNQLDEIWYGQQSNPSCSQSAYTKENDFLQRNIIQPFAPLMDEKQEIFPENSLHQFYDNFHLNYNWSFETYNAFNSQVLGYNNNFQIMPGAQNEPLNGANKGNSAIVCERLPEVHFNNNLLLQNSNFHDSKVGLTNAGVTYSAGVEDASRPTYYENNSNAFSQENMSSQILNYELLSQQSVRYKEKPGICEICGQQLSNMGNLRYHYRIHTGEKPFKCDTCNMCFTQKFSLQYHMAVHSEKKEYKCHVCNKEFKWKNCLHSHLTTHSKEKAFKCTLCEKTFSNRYGLRKHYLCHTNEKTYQCQICSKRFKNNYHLKVHSQSHATKNKYKCDICGRMLKTPQCLKSHILTHSSEKTHTCKICQKSFKAYCAMRRHLLVHTQERPHRCQVCDMTFQQACTLKRHLLVHTLEKPYKCHLCDNAFAQDSSLKSHLQTHVEGKPYVCQICNKAFSRKDMLKKHILSHDDLESDETACEDNSCGD